MRFFTEEWATGGLSDAEYEQRLSAYDEHLAKILSSLTPSARILATSIEVHDALLEEVVLEPARQKLSLSLVCGDLQEGYFDLQIRYLGVDPGSFDRLGWERIAAASKSELLYHELDLSAGDGFEHRFLFHPYREVAIQFRSLSLRVADRADREDRSRSARTVRFREL